MLAKKERLTTAAFNRSFSSGKRYHFPLCTVVVDRTTSVTSFHGSVVVGKKVAKRAVARNRLRRRVYGVLYRWAQQTAPQGVYIILLKPAAASASRHVLLQEVSAALATLSS